MREPAAREWIVLLEVADQEHGSALEPASLRRLLAEWPGAVPAALYSPDRYALQISIAAPDPSLALSSAIGLWKGALRGTALPEGDLIRSEVVTPEELEGELRTSNVEAAPGGARDVVGDELLRRALYDPLTDLANREIFLHDVRRALGTPASAPAFHAVAVVSLDRRDGSPGSVEAGVGDVLVKLAGRLRDAVRVGDSVARAGPDRFGFLFGLRSAEAAAGLAERLLAEVRDALEHQGQGDALMGSVGVATMSGAGDADQLMLMAEAAMHAAREAGGDCHREFGAGSSG